MDFSSMLLKNRKETYLKSYMDYSRHLHFDIHTNLTDNLTISSFSLLHLSPVNQSSHQSHAQLLLPPPQPPLKKLCLITSSTSVKIHQLFLGRSLLTSNDNECEAFFLKQHGAVITRRD
ncbi:CLUMA_CG003934, isoform A [Clunio marinus]|uniref:CLUMA_CG003934, isoform A n=1 Tax=Clunio marinus TaxID=568069 RepID=A0A1J1HQA2_9DIPT|nr:CLUMA_CG003934, isoform A [Clunio marinus]